MKVNEISIVKTYNVGNYESLKIGVNATVESSDTVEDSFRELNDLLNYNFVQLRNVQKVEKNPITVTVTAPTPEQVAAPTPEQVAAPTPEQVTAPTPEQVTANVAAPAPEQVSKTKKYNNNVEVDTATTLQKQPEQPEQQQEQQQDNRQFVANGSQKLKNIIDSIKFRKITPKKIYSFFTFTPEVMQLIEKTYNEYK